MVGGRGLATHTAQIQPKSLSEFCPPSLVGRIGKSLVTRIAATSNRKSLATAIATRDFFQGAPKERRRGRAEKRLSKRVFLESPFLLCPLKVFS